MPAASTHVHAHMLLTTMGTWWRNWIRSRSTAAEIEALGAPEMSRIAQDINLSIPELRTFAGKWPDAADLLTQRLAALQLDETTLGPAAPGVLRDMQRLCTACCEKLHCSHDLDEHSSNTEWRKYCPNVETLDALEFDRAARHHDHHRRR